MKDSESKEEEAGHDKNKDTAANTVANKVFAQGLRISFFPDHEKMNVSLCQIGAGLVFGSIIVCMFQTSSKKMFMASLSAEQQAVFKGIIRERMFIYISSLLAGSVAGFIALKSSDFAGENTKVCTAVGIAFVVAYIAYQLWPKSRFMLEYLVSPQQTLAWVNYYKSMKQLYHIGFLIGLVGFGVFSKGVVRGGD